MNILRMINPIQAYAWGSKSFISELLNNKEHDGSPQAEMWMGAHPKSSSLIQNGENRVNLNYIIAEDPCDFLGSVITRTYCDQMPFLMKVLAADAPLSIQAHPNQKQARDGFIYENKNGIPLDAPERNYKDANHKPELIVALTPFTAMCGFRDYPVLVTHLKRFFAGFEAKYINDFLIQPSPQSLKHLFANLLSLSGNEKHNLLNLYMNNIARFQPETEEQALIRNWSIELNKRYPDDIGITSPAILNIIELKPFEALYLEAGVLHSYLHGAGMEIMANSDNVLRGGLTPKHIATAELVNILDFLPKTIAPIAAQAVSETESFYLTPAQEFILSILRHDTNSQSDIPFAGSPEILFCYQGNFVIENCSQFLSLEQGQSLFVPYEVDGYSVQGKGILFRARCNL